jgi:hypothetical protein
VVPAALGEGAAQRLGHATAELDAAP